MQKVHQKTWLFSALHLTDWMFTLFSLMHFIIHGFLWPLCLLTQTKMWVLSSAILERNEIHHPDHPHQATFANGAWLSQRSTPLSNRSSSLGQRSSSQTSSSQSSSLGTRSGSQRSASSSPPSTSASSKTSVCGDVDDKFIIDSFENTAFNTFLYSKRHRS